MSRISTDREGLILRILQHGERYGRDIRDQYECQYKQLMPLGSLYTTLDRMEKKGFVESRRGETTPGRRGNRRKYFRICAPGVQALDEWQAVKMALSQRLFRRPVIGGGGA